MSKEPGRFVFDAYMKNMNDKSWPHWEDASKTCKQRWAAVERACMNAAYDRAAKVAARFGSEPAPASDGMGTRILRSVDGHQIAAAILALKGEDHG